MVNFLCIKYLVYLWFLQRGYICFGHGYQAYLFLHGVSEFFHLFLLLFQFLVVLLFGPLYVHLQPNFGLQQKLHNHTTTKTTVGPSSSINPRSVIEKNALYTYMYIYSILLSLLVYFIQQFTKCFVYGILSVIMYYINLLIHLHNMCNSIQFNSISLLPNTKRTMFMYLIQLPLYTYTINLQTTQTN